MTLDYVVIFAVFFVFLIAFAVSMYFTYRQTNKAIKDNDQLAGEIHELRTYLKTKERVSELQVETTSLRENIKDTKDMTDDELREWIEKHMNESKMFTDPDLSLKDMALRLGLTQKKIKQLVKDSERYNRLYDYLTEKRVLYACELIKANPQWSMEAVSKDSGFVSRTTFQTEFKKRIGVTPAQYRANSQYDVVRVK